jgi:deoxyribodipyrimidine photolyase-related protein
MTRLCLVLGDQLSLGLSALRDADKANDVVLMVEVMEEGTYVRHHKKKIAFILAAMRHHASALEREGFRVDYVRLDQAENSGSFTGEIVRALSRHNATGIVVTEPGEWRVLEMMRDWQTLVGVPVEIRADDRFIATHQEFEAWAKGKTQLRMEFFYREMRRKTGYLMVGAEPEGGQWNFDADNREALPKQVKAPQRRMFQPDAITREVMALVDARFGDHFGDLEPFWMGVTRDEALEALDDFLTTGLPNFGRYQDAMRSGEPFLFHGLIGLYLNVGLLDPREVCTAVLLAYARGAAPLNAVEGFVRQIIGWREYIRGIYWLKMPGYTESNWLEARRSLPWFFWSGETRLNCLKQTIIDTKRNAYAHHIQRLMVTGNFALLAGLKPREVEEWYLIVYADAFEWVELPNTHGMVLYADGGVVASKPYAASGAYIDRMSDYCGTCAYDPAIKVGPGACPFNLLYWDFVARNSQRLSKNPRMAMPYRSLAKMDPARVAQIRREAEAFLEGTEMSPQAEA